MEAQQEDVDGPPLRPNCRDALAMLALLPGLGHEGLACRIHGSRLSTYIAIASEDQSMDFARSEGARPPTRMPAVRARIPSVEAGGIEPRTTGSRSEPRPRKTRPYLLDYPGSTRRIPSFGHRVLNTSALGHQQVRRMASDLLGLGAGLAQHGKRDHGPRGSRSEVARAPGPRDRAVLGAALVPPRRTRGDRGILQLPGEPETTGATIPRLRDSRTFPTCASDVA
jgi:hypothetical protein